MLLLVACGDDTEDRARAHAARKLGVAAAALRITERSELSLGPHHFLRATTRETPARELTVVVTDGIVLDAGTPGAFETVARAHDVARKWTRFSASRVAGWFGALGGGGVCGEPLGDDAQLTPLADGVRLSYRFARNDAAPRNGAAQGGTVKRCDVDLGEDGTVRRADAQAVSLARR